MLPTNVAKLFLSRELFKGLLDPEYWERALIDFQKVALVEEFDKAYKMFSVWLDDEPSEEQMKEFEALYELTRTESKGVLIQYASQIAGDDKASSSNKLDALRLLDQFINGDGTVDPENAAKLIIKLADTKDEE